MIISETFSNYSLETSSLHSLIRISICFPFPLPLSAVHCTLNSFWSMNSISSTRFSRKCLRAKCGENAQIYSIFKNVKFPFVSHRSISDSIIVIENTVLSVWLMLAWHFCFVLSLGTCFLSKIQSYGMLLKLFCIIAFCWSLANDDLVFVNRKSEMSIKRKWIYLLTIESTGMSGKKSSLNNLSSIFI